MSEEEKQRVEDLKPQNDTKGGVMAGPFNGAKENGLVDDYSNPTVTGEKLVDDYNRPT